MLPPLAYSVARVRAAEEAFPAALADGTLMARAAWAASQAAIQVLHDEGCLVTGARVVILVGPGNNGGDALWAGAHLARRGASVQAITTTEQVHVAGMHALKQGGGGSCSWAKEPERARQLLAKADLILDGLVGIGGKGPLRAPAADLVHVAAGLSTRVLAIDLPSGLDADSGAVLGAVLPADCTVTFGCAKPGLLLAPGCAVTGRLQIIDIGIGPALTEPACQWLTDDKVADLLAQVRARADDHKYRRGVVGIAAGSRRYLGAAMLTVGAALRSGVGMVRFLDRDDGCAVEVVRRNPEVVTEVEIPNVNAWVVGPGLSQDAVTTVEAILRTDVPVVLDATALAILADEPALLDLAATRRAPTVLTPHYGEAKRLAGAYRCELTGEPLNDADQLARITGCIVLLKGPGTVVAGAGVPWVNRTGGAELSCAGSGDVLSGLLGGLLAAQVVRKSTTTFLDRVETAEVAALAAHLHGLAGKRAAQHAPHGRALIASDLVNALV